MKKRKQKNQLKINNESTHYDFDDVQIEELHNEHETNTEKFSKIDKENSILDQGKKELPDDDKTCSQTLKEKLEYFWVQMINYLQFDRVFSNEEIELLKKENYTIKTRYPDNYYLTYQERSKTFGISIEEITRTKLEEEQIKNKNFWNELKRFVCCQGGNELEENDEMHTAVSESEYFYLNKAKKNHKNSIEMTEEALIEKPFNRMSREENYNEKEINEKSFFNKQEKPNIFYEDNEIKENNNRDSFEVGHNKNIKQIDMNNVRSIKKEKETLKKEEKEEKLKNDEKINDFRNEKEIKDTEVIYIHNKEAFNSNNEQKQEKNNYEHLQKIEIKNENKYDQIDEVFMSNRNSKNINEDDKENLTSQKNNPKNENQKPVDPQHENNNHEKSKQSKDQSSTNPSSPNPSLEKLIPHINNFDNPQSKFEGKTSEKPNENINFSQIDNSDMISVAESENKEISMSKKQKRNKSKIPKEEHFLNLQVIEKVEDNENELNSIEDNVDNELGRKKYSLSSHQLNKKSKKRPFNVDQFDESVDEGLEEDLQQSFNMEFGGNKNNNVNDSNNSIPIFKKKKTRNKKLFNIEAENEKTDEIIIYDENEEKYEEESQNESKIYAETIDGGSNMGAHGTSNIKKRKKAKKIKEEDIENDDYNAIVIEGEENVESEINNQTDKIKNNFSTNNSPTHQSSLSPPMKADKKRKKKTRLREEIEKEHEEFDIVDLGEIN